MFSTTTVIVAAIQVMLLATIGVQEYRVQAIKTELAQERQSRSDDRVVMERSALKATEDARSEEQRRTTALRKVTDDAQQQTALARADAASAASAAAGLRQRVRTLAARRCGPAGNPPVAAGGQADGETIDLLANMFVSMEAHGRVLAATADRAINSGAACERAYDALTEGGAVN